MRCLSAPHSGKKVIQSSYNTLDKKSTKIVSTIFTSLILMVINCGHYVPEQEKSRDGSLVEVCILQLLFSESSMQDCAAMTRVVIIRSTQKSMMAYAEIMNMLKTWSITPDL